MRVPTNQSGCSTNYEYVCGGFANGCSIASICIARILIQIKLLTRLLPLGMTSCLNIPPSNWWWCCCSFVLLLFRFARLPPKQINEQNNRTNTVQKYSRLKNNIHTHRFLLNDFEWVYVLCRFRSHSLLHFFPLNWHSASRNGWRTPPFV